MFILRSTKDDTVYYIRKSVTNIGRQAGDIILKDNGVSRNHAELLIEDRNLYLISLKEQLRTAINTVPVAHKIRNSLQVGDVVKFGMSFEFRVEKVSFRVATSSLPEAQKSELEVYLKQIDTKLSHSFRPDCTHLVVQELCPSVKVICAVILNIPMVTVEFFKELGDVSKNVPHEADFRPIIKPSIHEVREAFFRFNDKRKTLFKSKTFVFVDEKSGKPMKTMIALAGGEYSPFDPSLISEYRRTSIPAKYIIIHYDAFETLSVSQNIKTAYSEVCAALTACQWRAIPMQEIAFALLKCNCDVDCNPAFNKGKNLLRFAHSDDSPYTQIPLAQSTQLVENILAHASETQAILPRDVNAKDIIIPPSLETELDDFDVPSPSNSKSIANSQALARRNRTEMNQNSRKTAENVDRNIKNAEKRIDLSKSRLERTSNPFEDDDETFTQNKGSNQKSNVRQKSVRQVGVSPFLMPALPSTSTQSNSGEINDGILTVIKRKSGPRSDATLENPITKKVATEDVVLSNRDSENSSQWICKSTSSQNKRKYQSDVSEILEDGDDIDLPLPIPIKIEPIEPTTKKPKKSFVTPKSRNVFEIPNSEDISENDNKLVLQTLTQAMTSYFEACIKFEDITDANATVVGDWISCRPKIDNLEKEDKAKNECLLKEYAEQYFCNFEEKFQSLDLGSTQKDECQNGVVNYKKFRKTQHIPVTLKTTFVQGMII